MHSGLERASDENLQSESGRLALYQSAVGSDGDAVFERASREDFSANRQGTETFQIDATGTETDRIWNQARRWLGTLQRAREQTKIFWTGPVPPPIEAEIDLMETLLDSPGGHEIVISLERPKDHAVVLCVDASMSMMGEKRQWTSLAIAAFAWLFRDISYRAVFFESGAKEVNVKGTGKELLETWLGLELGGTTHLEAGLELALENEYALRAVTRRTSTVLITDGKFTNGRDPRYLAPQFRNLHVLALGQENGRGAALCVELGRMGHGRVYQVPEIAGLPRALVGLARQLNR